jgi:hypothetical protein
MNQFIDCRKSGKTVNSLSHEKQHYLKKKRFKDCDSSDENFLNSNVLSFNNLFSSMKKSKEKECINLDEEIENTNYIECIDLQLDEDTKVSKNISKSIDFTRNDGTPEDIFQKDVINFPNIKSLPILTR